MEYAPTSHNRTVYASPLKRIGLQPEGYAQWRLKSVGKNVYCIQICKFYFAYLCGDKQLSSMICNSKNRRAGSVPAKDGTAAPVEKIYRSFMAHISPIRTDMRSFMAYIYGLCDIGAKIVDKIIKIM